MISEDKLLTKDTRTGSYSSLGFYESYSLVDIKVDINILDSQSNTVYNITYEFDMAGVNEELQKESASKYEDWLNKDKDSSPDSESTESSDTSGLITINPTS
jgi:hypothetical protein